VLTVLILILMIGGAAEAGVHTSDASAADLADWSTSRLEARLGKIDSELGELASWSMRSGTGSVGFRSEHHPDPNHREWIQVHFDQETPIDQIVLVPAIWRDTQTGFQADGFPVEFQVIAGTGSESKTIAAYTQEAPLLPRVAPLVVSFQPITASWVRLEAHTLGPRAWDQTYLLQLAEIMIFDGEENVALRQSITCSSASNQGQDPPRLKESVVDGFVPYLMDAAQGEQSIPYVSPINIGPQPWMSIDLGEVFSLNRLHLHAVDSSDTVPQTTLSDFLIPKRLRVEGAQTSDFSDAELLVEYIHQNIYDTGPILMRNFPKMPCRYVRLTAVEPYLDTWFAPGGSKIGFSEIEVFSEGRNVAIGRPVEINFQQLSPDRSLSTLTDGRNLYGNILPLREWMEQLARRHDLEAERPRVTSELAQRYQTQKKMIQRMAWLIAVLGGGIVIILLIEKVIRQKVVFRTRERIAANLHDELGANLHAIGMLGDMAQEEVGASERLKEIVSRIRALTERSGSAARYCADILGASDLCQDLTEDMKRSSERLLADTQHEITFEGEEALQLLSPRRRIDLFLFYKESLTNIIRHASATTVSTHLAADRKRISLTITDDGIGIAEGSHPVPASLKRRARILGAHLNVSSPENGGTRIRLQLKPRRSGWFRQ